MPSGFRVWGLRLGLRVWGLGFRVWGLGLRVKGFKGAPIPKPFTFLSSKPQPTRSRSSTFKHSENHTLLNNASVNLQIWGMSFRPTNSGGLWCFNKGNSCSYLTPNSFTRVLGAKQMDSMFNVKTCSRKDTFDNCPCTGACREVDIFPCLYYQKKH